MVEAEATLRLSLVPPLTVLLVVLAVETSAVWLLGLLFTVALYIQAAARHWEARALEARHARASVYENLDDKLKLVESEVDNGNFRAAREALMGTRWIERLMNV